MPSKKGAASSKSSSPKRSRRHAIAASALAILILLTAALITGSYRLEEMAGRGSSEERLQRLELAQFVRPFSPRLHQKVARAYLALGRAEEAAGELAHPLETDTSRLLRVEALIWAGKYSEAASLAKSLPSARHLQRAEAFASFASGDVAGADQKLREVMRSDVDRLDRRLAAFLALPDLEQAARLLHPADSEIRRFLEQSSPGSARLASAALLRREGLLEPAREHAEQAVSEYPSLPSAWLELARIHLLRGDPRAALEAAGQAEGLYPLDPESALLAAEAHEKLGDREAATQARARAAALRKAP